jgi:glycosyltransferase involved in cell wall biosynthesis
MTSRLPDLTVAICTHDRPALLARALASVVAQSPAPAEVLVVDNAPSDGRTRELVERQFPGVRYLLQPVPGLDFARNLALAEAVGQVVAFLDDDAVAAPGWAEALCRNFADPRVAVCTGRVEPLAVETDGQRLFEANGGFSRGTVRITLPDDAARRLHGRRVPLIAWAVSVGSGCSYAVRVGAARALGGFDEALDLGALLPGGGDHDLLWRALQSGARVVYEPDALAWHEHRRELGAAHQQIVGHQRALLAFLGKHLVRSPARLPLFGYLTWRLLKPGVRLVRRGLGRDPLPAGVLVRMWWHCWAGLATYPQARRVARARREQHAW